MQRRSVGSQLGPRANLTDADALATVRKDGSDQDDHATVKDPAIAEIHASVRNADGVGSSAAQREKHTLVLAKELDLAGEFRPRGTQVDDAPQPRRGPRMDALEQAESAQLVFIIAAAMAPS